jgi:surface polysaccharide O-acyltransferase-like enzyme
MSSPLSGNRPGRKYYLDLARAVAILSITLNHAVNRSYDNYYYQQAEFQSIALWDSAFKAIITVFSHIGVPLFLMISGALLFTKRMEDGKDLKKFYRHNLLGLLITTEIWYVIIYFFMVFLDPSNTIREGGPLLVAGGLVQTMLFQNQTTTASLWYMPMIMSLYTTIPFAIIAKNKLGLKALCLPLILVFINFMCIPAFNVIQGVRGSWKLYTALREYNLCSVYYLYIFAGVAVSEGMLDKLTTRTVAWLTAACFSLTCVYQLWLYSTPVNHLLMEPSPSILITATLVFELIRRVAPRFRGWSGGITWLSKTAFGNYFVHILIMSGMYWYMDLSALARPLRVVFYEAVSFGGALLIIWALAKIPACKKYLFQIKD